MAKSSEFQAERTNPSPNWPKPLSPAPVYKDPFLDDEDDQDLSASGGVGPALQPDGLTATAGLSPIAADPFGQPTAPAAVPGLTPLNAAPVATPGLQPLGAAGGDPLQPIGAPLQPMGAMPGAAPAAAPVPNTTRRVRSKTSIAPLIMPPAIGVLVTAALCGIHQIGFTIWLIIQNIRAAEFIAQIGGRVGGQFWLYLFLEFGTLIASAAVCVVIVLGAVSMLQSERFVFVFTTSIFQAIGMIGWLMLLQPDIIGLSMWNRTWGVVYCAIGVPFGIWAIVILCLPHVKNQFRG